MKERPILFSAPMVRALLDGRKAQTRRLCKPAQAANLSRVIDCQHGQFGDEEGAVLFRSPYGQPGDRLWVREAWRVGSGAEHWKPKDILPNVLAHDKGITVLYEAGGWVSYGPPGRDEPVYPDNEPMPSWAGKARPSIHMPRAFSRILLEVVSVRVERLQGISEADAIAEGIERHPDFPSMWKRGPLHTDQNFISNTAFPRLAYRSIWESINGAGTWNANPWVWVIEFNRSES